MYLYKYCKYNEKFNIVISLLIIDIFFNKILFLNYVI